MTYYITSCLSHIIMKMGEKHYNTYKGRSLNKDINLHGSKSYQHPEITPTVHVGSFRFCGGRKENPQIKGQI